MLHNFNQILVKRLRLFFQKKKNIEMAFLFGSQAKGRAILESDIDIAIWPSRKFKLKDMDLLWKELELLTRKNVDVVRLNKANPSVAWAALRGIPLLIRNRKFFIDFMLNVSDEAEFMQDFNLDLYKKRQYYLSRKDKQS